VLRQGRRLDALHVFESANSYYEARQRQAEQRAADPHGVGSREEGADDDDDDGLVGRKSDPARGTWRQRNAARAHEVREVPVCLLALSPNQSRATVSPPRFLSALGGNKNIVGAQKRVSQKSRCKTSVHHSKESGMGVAAFFMPLDEPNGCSTERAGVSWQWLHTYTPTALWRLAL
jgi:hypothetical protein